MEFKYFNPKDEKKSCVVRAISRALNKDYEKIKEQLCNYATMLNYNTYNEIEVFEKYLVDNGFLKLDHFKKNKIKDLNLNFGIYIIFCNKDDFYHMVTIINNVLYDKSDIALDMEVINVYKIDIDNFKKSCMTESFARQISEWQYSDEYSVYNLPSYEQMLKSNYSITKKENYDNYICYLKDNIVIGYINIKLMNKEIYLGIGIKPEECSRGFGSIFINDALNKICTKYPKYGITLEVRSFNKRAIKCYEKSGFKIKDKVVKKDRFGNFSEFVNMEYKEMKQ